MNALTPALADTVLATPVAEPLCHFSDLHLITRCRAYVDALRAYDQDGGKVEVEDDPLWDKVIKARAAVNGMRATSLPGLMAKAEVAQYLASQPDGRIDYSDSFTGTWLKQVVEDLVALDEGTFALRSDLPASADRELLELKCELDALNAVIQRECRKSPRGGRGHKKRTQRRDRIIADALTLPAHSREGRAFLSWLRYLAEVRTIKVLRAEVVS